MLNSQSYSTDNVGTGVYTFWGYEHLLFLPTLSGIALSVAQQLETFVDNNASVSGVPVGSKKVNRNGDGQPLLRGGAPPNVP